MSENFKDLENVEDETTTTATEQVPEESVEYVSSEAFENADKPAQNGKKAKKPLSNKAKIGIIAGVSVAVVLLSVIIALVVILFKPTGPSGAVDDSVVTMQTYEINVGKVGSIGNGSPIVVLDNVLKGTDFSCDSTNAIIEDKTIEGVTKKVMTLVATSGNFNLKYKNAEGKTETIKVNIIEGVNVYTIADFDKAIEDKAKVINLQADITATEQNGYTLDDVVINGNGYIFDATSISARLYNDKGKPSFTGNTVFSIGTTPNTEVIVRDLHIIGERVEKVEGKEFSLDEFESNGTIFSVYGNDKGERAKFTLDHSIIENAHKHLFINSADVVITNSLLRNGSDAIIAVETNNLSGAKMTVKNNIISNSVVAGILFCGWTDVGNKTDVYCELNIEGFLDIYNWKDTKTAKLVPASESAATIVNNMVGEQIKRLTKNKEAVKEYMVKKDGEFFVHIGIVILATPNLKSNKSVVNSADSIGYVKRGFPIPSFASAIARTCELLGYNQTTSGSKTAVQPRTGYENSANFKELGMSIVK